MAEGSIIVPREKIALLEGDLDLLGLFMLLVAKARYKPGVAPKGTPLNPGQLVAGKRSLAGLTKRTESWCYRALNRLRERTLIETESNREGTVVTIAEWDSYTRLPGAKRTNIEPRSNQDRTASEPRSNHNRTSTKTEGRRQKPPPPAPSAEEAAAAAAWRKAEEAVSAAGVSAATAAIGAARQRGLTPDDVLALVGEFTAKSGAWTGGALYQRLTGDLSAWPDPQPSYREPEDERLRAERERLAGLRIELETELGTAFSRLPRSEKHRFAMLAHDRFPGLDGTHLRTAMLEQYAEHQDHSSPTHSAAGAT